MAVFGRVRNWRVCTRSLYTVPPPSFYLSFFPSPFCNSSLPAFGSPLHLSPFLFRGTTASRSFFRRRDFCATRFVCFLELSSTRRVVPRTAPRCVASSSLLLSLVPLRLLGRLFLANARPQFEKERDESLRFAETALCRGLRRWSFDASRSDYARLFPLARSLNSAISIPAPALLFSASCCYRNSYKRTRICLRVFAECAQMAVYPLFLDLCQKSFITP